MCDTFSYHLLQDAPENPAEYGFGTVCKDLAGLLDHLKIPNITVIGHDWGGAVTWRFAQFYPDRVTALISFCTPYVTPAKQDVTLQQIVQVLPNFKYQLYLVTPEAEKDINENVGKFFRRIFRPIADIDEPLIDPKTNRLAEGRSDRTRHEKVPEKVMEYYIKKYTERGACGGLNWYKQTHNNYVQCRDLDPIIRKPAMMVIAELDKALPPSMAEKMPQYIPGVEMHLVVGSGHWILWEKPQECNKLLKEFLAKVDPICPKLQFFFANSFFFGMDKAKVMLILGFFSSDIIKYKRKYNKNYKIFAKIEEQEKYGESITILYSTSTRQDTFTTSA